MSIRFKISGKAGKTAYTLVDDEDYDFVKKYNWTLREDGYAARYEWSKIRKNTVAIFLHKELTNTTSKQWVDHINRDKLDNRKSNLRVCTISENNQNKDKFYRKDISKYHSKYVGVRKSLNKWIARIQKDSRYIHLGTYSTEREAALAYNIKAMELFGVYAKVNSIE